MDMRGQPSALGMVFDDADEVRVAEREVRRDQEREDYNISTMDTAKAASTGKRSTGAGMNSHVEETRRKDAARQKDKTDLQLQLDAMRAELQNELTGLNARLDDIGDMRAGIEDVFNNGYDVGEDGRISNEQAEKALQEYEERTGQSVDRNDEAVVMAALHAQWEEFDRETEQINKRANEIDDALNIQIPQAERVINDPNSSEGAKQDAVQTVRVVVDNSASDGASGLDQTQKMADVGHTPDLNESAQTIQQDANALLMGI